MDLIDGYLSDYATPEQRDLYMQVHEMLVSLGHTDHEIDIENIINMQSTMDTAVILNIIDNDLLTACKKLTQQYYIVCRDDNQLKPYLDLMYFLSYLENTIDSEALLYHHNEELTPHDQLLAWVDVFFPEYNTSIGDLTLDVMSSLIENILETHELKADLEPIEFDLTYHKVIKRLKLYPHTQFNDLVGVELIKSALLKEVLPIAVLADKYRRLIYKQDALHPNLTADNIITMALVSDVDSTALGNAAKEFTNLIYDDVKKVSELTHRIDTILNPAGELCKIMNTI